MKVIRNEYLCMLKNELPLDHAAFAACREGALRLIKTGRLMTAAMYMYKKQLFLYTESLENEVTPEEFLSPLGEIILPQPLEGEAAPWVKMVPVFWHAEPTDAASWRESRPRQRRRGRIAYLFNDKLTEYVYHHRALTEEGVFRGDKYMFISLWGNLLFSYFEEPRSSDNVNGSSEQSRAINDWMRVDPDSHFKKLPGSNGQNFLLIEACFDVGESDI